MRGLLKIFRILLLTLGIIIVLLGATAWFFKDQLRQALLREMNRFLAVPVKTGIIEAEFFKFFPYMAITIPDVRIPDVLDHDKPALLEADELAFLFNPIQLMRGHFQLYKLVMERGQVRIRFDANGQGNYTFWKVAEGAAQEDLDIELRSIVIKDVRVQYTQENTGLGLGLYLMQAQFSGAFHHQVFTMDLNTDLRLDTLYTPDIHISMDQPLNLVLTGGVEKQNKRFKIETGALSWGPADLAMKGEIVFRDEGSLWDMQLQGKGMALDQIRSWLPEKATLSLQPYQLSGTVEWSGEIKGLWGQESIPFMALDFALDRGSAYVPESDSRLTDLQIRGRYSNGQEQSLASSVLYLAEFSGTSRGGPIRGTFTLRNFIRPFVDIKLSGKGDLGAWGGFIGLPFAQGNFSVDIDLEGDLAQLQEGRGQKMKALISLEKGSIPLSMLPGYRHKVLDSLSMRVMLTGTDLQVQHFKGNLGKSNLNLRGQLPRFMGWASGRDNLFRFQLEQMGGAWDWYDLFPPGPEPGSGSAAAQVPVDMPSTQKQTQANKGSTAKRATQKDRPFLYQGNLRVDLDRFSYNKIFLNRPSADLEFKEGDIRFNSLHALVFEGAVAYKGMVFLSRPNRIVVDGHLSCRDINISQLFAGFNDFDQDFLTQDHLSGKLTGRGQVLLAWDAAANFVPEPTFARAEVLIDEGRLRNFEPMEALGRFIDLETLRDLRFQTLKTNLVIERQVIFLPETEVRSNALDLSISGTHSFDNIVDYKLQLALSQLLAGKSKTVQENKNQWVEDPAENRTRLFLTMKGPAGDPVIAWDRRSTGKKIKTNLREEGQTIKEVIREEFKEIFGPKKEKKPSKFSTEEDIPVQPFPSDTGKKRRP